MDEQDRIAAARVSGAVRRLTVGIDKGTPPEQAIAELRAISTDKYVLADALGGILHEIGSAQSFLVAAAELLRAAGADEQAAVAKLGWLRERDNKRAEGGFTL